MLRGIVGYNDNPSQLEAAAYFAYWLFIGVLYYGIRTGKIVVVTRPLRNLWLTVTGRRPKPESVELPD